MRRQTKCQKPRDISVAFSSVQNSIFLLKVSLGLGSLTQFSTSRKQHVYCTSVHLKSAK